MVHEKGSPVTSSILVFFVNGHKVEDSNVDPEWTLLYYLRKKLRLCGTKLGCAEGGCGACTVMLSKYDRTRKRIVHLAINACLAPVCGMHGAAVTTVEGIGSVRTRLHPVQERIARAHGSQCGFCTPGIVMSMYSLLRSLPGRPTMNHLEVAFQGNLCRCTGYRPIIEGYRTFTEEWEKQQQMSSLNNGVCGMGEQCCKNNNVINGITKNIDITQNGISENNSYAEDTLFKPDMFQPYDPTQELIFPPELSVSDVYDKQYLSIEGPRVKFFRPVTLEDFLSLKNTFPESRIVNGNTEVGVEVKFKNCHYPVLIMPNLIPELNGISVEKDEVIIGSAVTLTEVETCFEGIIKTEKGSRLIRNICLETRTRVLRAVLDILEVFAGKQIRNVASVGGNIMTGSPISDLNQILMAAQARLIVKNSNNKREITVDDKFWTGYRKNTILPNEVLCSIAIPFTKKSQYFRSFKQAKRRDDDIAIVNSAFFVELNEKRIENIRLAFGGMAPTTVLAQNTSKKLIGKEWNEAMVEEAFSLLAEEFSLHPGVPGGMSRYRSSLTLSFFFKFYLYVMDELGKQNSQIVLNDSYKSGIEKCHSLTPSSSQFFSKTPGDQEKYDLVGRPIVHLSAYKQATGEAVYCDDMPVLENEAFLAIVTSTRAHARLVSVDPSAALALNGVIGFVSADDIPPEVNVFGPTVHDELIFASEKVCCCGQIIGCIVANDQNLAQRAAKLVKIEYENLTPAIITTQEAIKEKSFFTNSPFTLKHGDVEKGFEMSDKIIEGEITIGGQEHFYLETQACVVIPKNEDDEMEVYSSTQDPSELQRTVASVLGVPHNKIVTKVKRLGGGFGGKETRPCLIALPAAVAAHKYKRPVRIMLDRDEDMMISGQRHPFYATYKVGFTKEGKILASQVNLYSNAGCSVDLSNDVMERAMTHIQNSSNIANIVCNGYVCKTNLPSNTAFRGFGGPQAMLVSETIIFHIAEELKMDPNLVHTLNFYKEGELTHYNLKIIDNNIQRCWEECLRNSNYDSRKQSIDNFNRQNRFKKRGISIIPTVYGVGFSVPFLNQAGALVLVYTDGSVLLCHGGVEMGQGLHTKMIQVASRALEISAELIHISETSTDKVPNTIATAASVSSELNGMAVINACNVINDRLAPIKKANPDGDWKTWVKEAYFSRISLSATGFYMNPYILDPSTPFSYFSFGVGCSEVEIDCLTGDHRVLRTDIVMDLGESLNPAIDVGQVEGGFMQGYGLFTMEEMVHSPEGLLYSRGPGAYKIPSFSDIPAQFNVSLLKGSSNPKAVYSSKAVGEPPLFLAASVFFAIREAAKCARLDNGLSGWFKLDSPATAARIRMACEDNITQKFPEPEEGTFKPWNVSV